MSIGRVYAICDHFEKSTGLPVLASTLKGATGYDRKQLRKWVKEGRLAEHDFTSALGQVQKAYTRPKGETKNETITGEEEIH